MRILVSWSGPDSHRVALGLRDWLPSVLHYTVPWVSSEDIDKGAGWLDALKSELASAQFGVICLVPANLNEPWVNFEAGAMALAMERARVAPLLIGCERAALNGPLAQFQSTVFEKDDVRRLLHSINRSAKEGMPVDRLDRTFELCWAGLSTVVGAVELRGPPLAAPYASVAAIPEPQVRILGLLSRLPDDFPTVRQIAGEIGENQTRTQYHIEQLEKSGFVDVVISLGSPAGYYLTSAGRALIVESGLA